jgi:hypothetical protein
MQKLAAADTQAFHQVRAVPFTNANSAQAMFNNIHHVCVANGSLLTILSC